MIHKVTTEPTLEPISVEELRAIIGNRQAGDNSRDEVIKARITAARLWCEWFSAYHIMRKTVTAYDCEFPACIIELDCPLVSVTSVKYLDSTGVDTTLAADQYLVDTVGNRITPAYGLYWPSVRQQPNSVRIEYLVGLDNAALVPMPIKQAIAFIVGQWEQYQRAFEGGGYPPDFPNVAKSLLRPYTDMRKVF